MLVSMSILKRISIGLGVTAAVLAVIGLVGFAQSANADEVAQKQSVINLGSKVPTLAQVKEGLFPDEACEELRKNGFKCMGFKPAVRFAIPSSNFKVGSAEIPAGLRRQLDVFAQALSGRADGSAPVVITGHADASGTDEVNMNLSKERADAVEHYLVGKGVNASVLKTEGKGSEDLADATKPYAAINRRVEIGRAQ